MELRALTDELSKDLETAIELAREFRFSTVALRQFEPGVRFPDYREGQAEALKKALGGALSLGAVSPGFYKDAFMEGDWPSVVGKDMGRATALAGELNAEAFTFFSFGRPEGTQRTTDGSLPRAMPAGVADVMSLLAKAARDAGFGAFLENCHGQWADTGRAAKQLIERIDGAMQLTWDPANGAAGYVDRARDAGEALDPSAVTGLIVEEWREVKDLVGDVHVRGITVDGGGGRDWTTPDKGCLDWRVLLDAMRGDGYDGPITIEHHQFHDAEAASRRTVDFLRGAIDH